MFKLYNISLKSKLIVYTVFMIAVTAILISVASYKASENIIMDQVGKQAGVSTRLMMVRTDDLLHNIQKAALTIAFDRRLVVLMSKSEISTYEEYKVIYDFSKYIANFNFLNSYISSIYIYNTKEMFYISSTSTKVDITEEDSNYQLIAKYYMGLESDERYKYFKWIGNKGKDKYGHNVSFITLIMPIRNYPNQLLGALIINVEENRIADILKDNDTGQDSDFFVQESSGIVVSSTEKEIIGNEGIITNDAENSTKSSLKRINGRNSLFTVQISPYNEWRYISIIPIGEMLKGTVDTLKNTILLIVFVTVAMLLVLSMFINNTFYKPVKYFINNIKASIRNKDVIEKIERNDEIGFIFNTFHDLLNENNQLLTNIYDQKVYLKATELKALQSQINPHFLYNTLDGAICMIKIDAPEEAEKMLYALVKLYRLTLDDSRKIITIRDEIENLKYYTIIQNIRYNGKIEFVFEIQEEILDYAILKLVLQPLVENAINHGVGKNDQPARIAIHGFKSGNIISLIVRDNGIGIPEARLQEIKKIINSEEINQDNYYVLQNVNRSLVLYYGDPYGLEIDSQENVWTEAKITIPAILNVMEK